VATDIAAEFSRRRAQKTPGMSAPFATSSFRVKMQL
jgi:hypothetical protein